MKKVLLFTILLLASWASIAQQNNSEASTYDGNKRSKDRRNEYCSKLYIDLGTGINATTGLLGAGVDYHFKEDISAFAGVGLISTWGTKFYLGGKGWLKPCHKGWSIGAGATYNTGISYVSLETETIAGTRTVDMQLLPQTNIFAAAWKYWSLGPKRKSRFYLTFGLSRSLTSTKYKQLSGPPITTNSGRAISLLAPGGFILGFGFCFGS